MNAPDAVDRLAFRAEGIDVDPRSRGEGRVAIPFRTRALASLTGYAIIVFVVAWQWSVNFGGLPPDLYVWDRAGDQFRAGVSPYGTDYAWGTWFFYAPPWGVAFATFSWLPIQVQAGVVFGIQMASLRYIAGSWLRAGYFGLFPMTGAELGNGSFNLLLAASVAAAVRGDGRLATFTALAKFSPLLAVRDWRRAAAALAVAGAVTLPFLPWWLDWGNSLLWAQANQSIGYPIPWVPRLIVAIGLLIVTRDRPWARILAAFLALPALYSYSIVLLYPLAVELLDRKRGTPRA